MNERVNIWGADKCSECGVWQGDRRWGTGILGRWSRKTPLTHCWVIRQLTRWESGPLSCLLGRPGWQNRAALGRGEDGLRSGARNKYTTSFILTHTLYIPGFLSVLFYAVHDQLELFNHVIYYICNSSSTCCILKSSLVFSKDVWPSKFCHRFRFLKNVFL